MNIDQHVNELYEQGFTALPGLFSAAECRQMRDIIDDYWRSQGSPSLAAADFGFTIHPMLTKVPAITPFLNRPEPVEIMRQALRDEVRLVHVGARVSGPQSVPRIAWHNHYTSTEPGQPSVWHADDLPKRDRIERLLGGVYVDGTLPDSGPLIVLPRRHNDPLGQPLGPPQEEWPGERKVQVPPGSFTIFDTALWHAAARGTGTAARRLWGSHYQGWNDSRPHPEDNLTLTPELEATARDLPVLKALITRDA